MRIRVCIIFLIILLFGSHIYAYSLANPTPSLLKGALRFSGEYTFAKRMIKGDGGPDFKIKSNRVLVKPSYCPYTGWELFGLLGSADLNFTSPDPITLENYNGSWELALGFGTKVHYYDFAVESTGEYIVRCYATALFFTHMSKGEVKEGRYWLWKSDYRWQEYMIGAYCSMQYKQIIPYVGLEWFYINGRVDRGAFRKEDLSSEYTKFFDQTAYFADPTQWPKPVIGMDLMLPAKIILSFELIPWNKDQTTLTFGISQSR
ncbi:hypothetical protein JXI42_02020 [bacterium]|nr:hypothetical protein [bacterium]